MGLCLTGPFDIFLISVARTLNFGPTREVYLLVAIKHVDGWPTSCDSKNDALDEALKMFEGRDHILFWTFKDDHIGNREMFHSK